MIQTQLRDCPTYLHRIAPSSPRTLHLTRRSGIGQALTYIRSIPNTHKTPPFHPLQCITHRTHIDTSFTDTSFTNPSFGQPKHPTTLANLLKNFLMRPYYTIPKLRLPYPSTLLKTSSPSNSAKTKSCFISPSK